MHDSAHPHTVAHTIKIFWQLHFEILEHPPYSPDLTQSDFHVIWPHRNALRGCHFDIVCELKEVVHVWPFTQLLHKLVQCWIKGSEMANVKQEVLGRTNHLLSFDMTWTA
jgi:hypothetical protein